MELDPHDWNLLIRSIERGNCILMLGPDAVSEKYGDEETLLMRCLAMHLKESLGAYLNVELPDDFERMVDVLKREVGYNDVEIATEEFFGKEREPSAALKYLAELPFTLVVDTTPGNHMEKAFLACEKPEKSPVSEWYNYTYNGDEFKELTADGTVESPLIYQLYGSIKEPESLVLSEGDLLDFLVNVIDGTPPLPTNISSAFKDHKKSFLFLGFGLKHWYLRILLHVLYRSEKRSNRSFALELFDDINDDAAVEKTRSFFQEDHKIFFFDMDLNDFAVELKNLFDQKHASNEDKNSGDDQLSDDAPSAFICHASEDGEFALDLAKRLKENGIQPWVDKKDLDVGDIWNSEIEKAVKEVNYFIVVQSKALIEKEEGYVNKEINLALERNKYFRGRSFILPVQTDDQKLEELKDIQSIDLRSDESYEALYRKIKRGYQVSKKLSTA